MISIHASREGGDASDGRTDFDQQISIHASREGGDQTKIKSKLIKEISIHASREGGDEDGPPLLRDMGQFQATPPVREATDRRDGEYLKEGISIHASREGGDAMTLKASYSQDNFNPRLP